MSEKSISILLISIVVVFVIFLLRHKIKNIRYIKGKFMGIHAEVGTHNSEQHVVADIEQTAEKNKISIHSSNATVTGIKQTAQKDNVLKIGTP